MRLLLLALLACALPVRATTYPVGPGRTYTQLTQVADRLHPGDVVEVDGNATYDAVTWKQSGTPVQPITIRGMQGGTHRPVIDAHGAADAFRMDVNHYVVEDLVISHASERCVYLHGDDLTLRRVAVHGCRGDGILGADTETGSMLLTEIEVHDCGNPFAPSQYKHPIYIATDQAAHPEAVLRIEKSWIHDNYSGNSIKSRAKTLKVFYNWIETTHTQDNAIEAIGPDPDGATVLCPVPNGRNEARLCTGEIVGNVLIANSSKANLVRLGGDGTGQSFGRYRLVNNTLIASDAFESSGAPLVEAFAGIESIELHNNIFWLQNGDHTGFPIVGDTEAAWTAGRRVTGTRNLVTGNASSYSSGPAAAGLRGLKSTIFVSTKTPIFASLATPATADLRLHPASPARMKGNAGSTSSPGFQLPSPTNLPELQPPMARPAPPSLVATPRPPATDDKGAVVPNTISIGAFEYARQAR